MNQVQQRDFTKHYLQDVLLKSHRGLDNEDEVMDFVERAGERTVLEEGGGKYYDEASDTMKFEGMELDALYEYVEEEILDAANYAWMLSVRVSYPGEVELARALVIDCFHIFNEVHGRREMSRGMTNTTRASTELAANIENEIAAGAANTAGQSVADPDSDTKDWRTAFAERFTWKAGDIIEVDSDVSPPLPPRPDVASSGKE